MAAVWLSSANANTLQLGKVATGGKAEFFCPVVSSNLTLSLPPSTSSLRISSRLLYASCPHRSSQAIERGRQSARHFCVIACLSSSSSTPASSATGTKLYVSGLSFRTTKESLTKAFQQFGELVEVNLVMDKIAKRPRGFAFLSYATEEESKKAIEGMHGKFLDSRVIFVEVAKPRPQIQKNRNPE